MSEAATPSSPVSLPPGWSLESDRRGMILVRANDAHGGALGWVTIDEAERAFALGICGPFGRASKPHPDYQGRGWRVRLYGAAIKELQDALFPIKMA